MRDRRGGGWQGALLLLAVLAGLLLGCGQDEGEGLAGGGTTGGGASPGSAIKPDFLRGARFTVGSKEFTEQLVLGQITVQALREAGAIVQDRTGIKGSEATRRALIQGDIDMYWEYTGTAQLIHFDREPIGDPQRQYQAVAQTDRANGITWLEPAPANNAYGIAVRRQARRSLDVATISDLGRLLERSPRDAAMCVDEEFVRRTDGLPGLERAYGFDLPRGQTVLTEIGQIYGQVNEGGRCTFGEVFLTDGRIQANELFVLEDDKQFFTSYNPCLNVRTQVLDRNPRVRDIFNDIAAELDGASLRSLNAQVDVEGQRPAEVARRWLDDNGFTG